MQEVIQEVMQVFGQIPIPRLPAGGMSFSKPVWIYSPEFTREHGDGWRMVSQQVIGQDESNLTLLYLLTRDVELEPVNPL